MVRVVESSRDIWNGPVGAAAIACRWITAFNDRAAETLVALADPEVEFRPVVIVGTRPRYGGHDGLRRWIADVVAAGAPQQVRVAEVRELPEGGVLALGDIVIADEAVSPFALLLGLRHGRVLTGRAYLSDDEILRKLGLVAD